MPTQTAEACPGKTPEPYLPYTPHPRLLAGSLLVLILCCVVPLSRGMLFWDMEGARTFMGASITWGEGIWAAGNVGVVLVLVPLAILFTVKNDLHSEKVDDRWLSVLGMAAVALFLTVIGFMGEV